jgi:HAMP domain-containing protein
MSKSALSQTASFGRLLLLFLAIMLVFLALTANQTFFKLQNEEEKMASLKLISSLDPVIAKTSEESFINDRFNEVFGTMNQNGIDSQELETIIYKIGQEFDTRLKCFFYQNNQLKKSITDDQEDLKLFKNLMIQLNLQGEAFKEAQRQVHQALLDWFGPGHRLELLQGDQNELWRYKHLDKDHFFIWKTFENGNSAFLIATDFPDFINRFKIIKKQLNMPSIGAGMPKEKRYEAPTGVDVDQMLAARIKSSLSGHNTIQESEKNWGFIEDEAGFFYCICDKTQKGNSGLIAAVATVFSISWIASLVSIALYLLSFFEINPGKKLCAWLDSISIRFRILGLFSMASVFPVIFTALIGATSLADRAEIIENQVAGESIANIYRLEKMISEKLSQSEKMADHIRKELVNTPATEEFFSEKLKKFGIPRTLSRLEVRDGSGATLFTTDDRKVHGVSEAMDMFSRIALKLHAPARMGDTANMISPAEVISESVLSTDEIGMATILRQRGKQWVFRMGTFPTVWYWDVYPELASGPAFMHYTAQFIAIYKQQVQETLEKQKENRESILLSTELNYRYNNFEIFPKIKGISERRLLDAAIVSMRTGKVVFRNISFNGVDYWLTIKPEKDIGSHVFLNLISKPDKLAALNPLKLQLATGGVLALIVSLLGALLLIRLIINPIGDIAAGINAIRERQHDFRIPVRRKDEFGVLSNAFNNVIEELKELEYGRIVQTSLLPDKIPVPKDYDLACFRASATDLAGDYHDVLPLSDGRTAIILGDVTGHGISAALAMAMAKATVDYMNLNGDLFPGPMMDKLNALFNRELKPRHKFMTLVTLVLEPESGNLQIDNAGQSYPYYFDAEKGLADEVQIPSMPLGATKKRRSRPEVRAMKSGDAVILYSDGIIECANHGGDMFGYDRFQDTFVELLKKGLSSEEILQSMIKRLDDFRKPGPYPDDVTLVLLRRL